MRNKRGVSLIEVLIAMLVITVASIATLTYFSYAMGGIGRQGNRRAALERACERLEQLMVANITTVQPADGALYWLSCAGSPCTWTQSAAPVTERVAVDTLPNQPMQTTVRWVDDPSAGTVGLDTLEFSVRVWFTGNAGNDDEFNRVHLRTLRTPLPS